MKKRIKIIAAVVCSLAVICANVFLVGLIGVKAVKANADKPYSTYVDINLELQKGEDHHGKEVEAHVTNKFTFLPSHVALKIYLYSSDTYTEDYRLMELENEIYDSDFNMWDGYGCNRDIKDTEKFWLARVEYNVNGTGWVEKTSYVIRA